VTRTIVQKYGGTSVGSVELIQRVAEKVAAVRARGDRIAVVVSAMAGVTNALVSAVEMAGSRGGNHRAVLDELRRRHAATIDELVSAPVAERLRETSAIDQSLMQTLGHLLDSRLFQPLYQNGKTLIQGHAGLKQVSELFGEKQQLIVRDL